jgi:hypothetical protein
MDTFYFVVKIVLYVFGVWAFIDRWRQQARDTEAWEAAAAMRRANEYIKRHEVPRSNHPFR